MIRAILMLLGLCGSLLVAFYCLRQVFRLLAVQSANAPAPQRLQPVAIARIRGELDDEVETAPPVRQERHAPHTH